MPSKRKPKREVDLWCRGCRQFNNCKKLKTYIGQLYEDGFVTSQGLTAHINANEKCSKVYKLAKRNKDGVINHSISLQNRAAFSTLPTNKKPIAILTLTSPTDTSRSYPLLRPISLSSLPLKDHRVEEI